MRHKGEGDADDSMAAHLRSSPVDVASSFNGTRCCADSTNPTTHPVAAHAQGAPLASSASRPIEVSRTAPSKRGNAVAGVRGLHASKVPVAGAGASRGFVTWWGRCPVGVPGGTTRRATCHDSGVAFVACSRRTDAIVGLRAAVCVSTLCLDVSAIAARGDGGLTGSQVPGRCRCVMSGGATALSCSDAYALCACLTIAPVVAQAPEGLSKDAHIIGRNHERIFENEVSVSPTRAQSEVRQ